MSQVATPGMLTPDQIRADLTHPDALDEIVGGRVVERPRMSTYGGTLLPGFRMELAHPFRRIATEARPG